MSESDHVLNVPVYVGGLVTECVRVGVHVFLCVFAIDWECNCVCVFWKACA